MEKVNYIERTWAEIDLDKMIESCRVIREEMVPAGTQLMAVLKADAYGHGARYLAPVLEKEGGVSWFAVACLSEAIDLRLGGVKSPILVLGLTDVQYAGLLSKYQITQTLGSLDYAKALNEAAKKTGVRIDGHIKVNTGMNRLGFGSGKESSETIAAEILEVSKMSFLTISGMYSHLYDSLTYDEHTHEKCYRQYLQFKTIRDLLKARGFEVPLCHLCNTGGTINYPELAMDMVRVGSLLWGLKGVSPGAMQRWQPALQPVFQLKTKIAMIRNICAGESVGYSSNYIAQKKMTIAIVSCGYADGFSRKNSNRGFMLVKGKRAPVIGNVCMDMTMLDITEIKDAAVGDIVTVFGKDGHEEISCGEAAIYADTIEPEITTVISRRVPRVYYRNHHIIHIQDYLLPELR